jgi:two-component system CheB/CheR fusion protein
MPDSRKSETPEAGVPQNHDGADSAHQALAVVGIGASAGGLDACGRLLDALPVPNGLAFILVQHLDPTHESMMATLLAAHTPMPVVQARDGMKVEPDHLYIIPPDADLTIIEDRLVVSPPHERHGARLPFDFFLHSLATEFGARAIGVVLSGLGADGSLGAKSVKEHGGLIIAQDPGQAEFDGMPRSAISAGAVDLVLPLDRIPEALISYHRHANTIEHPVSDQEPAWLDAVIALLRTQTSHDFTYYKRGTLLRRTQRRMAIAAIEPDAASRYLELLRNDADELDRLANDLLINVTRFFRDETTFDHLSRVVIPDLLRDRASDDPIRIWIAGCSTGEETYSLAMLFSEQIAAMRRHVKVQMFASDVDEAAIAFAREGLYPEAISADVSPQRLGCFFTREAQGYRIASDLRQTVIFAVQDLLADPPFVRLDMLSCRNLLIYLLPEAQARVIALFHFALRENGVLVLGRAESIGDAEGRFLTISKSERIFRRIGRNRPEDLNILNGGRDSLLALGLRRPGQSAVRTGAIAEFCRQKVMDAFAPASVLINARRECLYVVGAIDQFLMVAQGPPVQDLFAMARDGVQAKLLTAIQRAGLEKRRVVVSGGQVGPGGLKFRVAAEPVSFEGEDLLLLSFIDEPREREAAADDAVAPDDLPRVAQLEEELQSTRAELQAAIHSLELSHREQVIKNEETLSVNEEYQATNEELLTSKEELQSLNEELTALNAQLQQTLERARTTSNDLKNVLYSTDVATIVLDAGLNIRFFTPSTRTLFNIIPGDVGRPLVDLNSLANDAALLPDARRVLETSTPVEREIETGTGVWFARRIQPYRTDEAGVEGVVITFNDITERKLNADALQAARHQAEAADAAKSRFLAVASHDLRQPLQALRIYQGLLARTASNEQTRNIVCRIADSLNTMSGMLNALLDLNQIEAGTVKPAMTDFVIGDLLRSLRDEFLIQAQAKNLELRCVPCSLRVHSDLALLTQMLRNLVGNALKYTTTGKVLLGCRRCAERVSVEVWDTGVGIAEKDINAIFEPYHQINNPARESAKGLGLGLSIVQRTANLLGHSITVRSKLGKGAVFAIALGRAPGAKASDLEGRLERQGEGDNVAKSACAILLIEDEQDVRESLSLMLRLEGFQVMTAHDGPSALGLVASGEAVPDLILTDFGLPGGMNGIELAGALRESLHRAVPVIVLTGDIRTSTLRAIADKGYAHVKKPTTGEELFREIKNLQFQFATRA